MKLRVKFSEVAHYLCFCYIRLLLSSSWRSELFQLTLAIFEFGRVHVHGS